MPEDYSLSAVLTFYNIKIKCAVLTFPIPRSSVSTKVMGQGKNKQKMSHFSSVICLVSDDIYLPLNTAQGARSPRSKSPNVKAIQRTNYIYIFCLF